METWSLMTASRPLFARMADRDKLPPYGIGLMPQAGAIRIFTSGSATSHPL